MASWERRVIWCTFSYMYGLVNGGCTITKLLGNNTRLAQNEIINFIILR